MTEPATRSIAIRLIGLSAVFHHERRGDITAVNELDLDVGPGEFLTLLGASGCGKTTTLRMIAGFQAPSAGKILFGGEDVTALPANRRDIGFVFQSYALFPHLSVFENVAYGLRVKRQNAAEIVLRVEQGLLQVGLTGLGDRMIGELSGGQQQRVALARAIAIKPRVLLFDEPLSNLDAHLRIQMRTEIARLQKELAITTIYVTHDQEEAMAISDRIAIMDGGRIAQIGTAEELYQRPTSRFVAGFLGNANLIGGVVIAADGLRTIIDISGFRWEIDTISPVPVGQRVDAVVRPEAIAFGGAGTGPEGTIESRVYLGAKAEYAVRRGDRLIQVVQSNPLAGKSFHAGDAVCLRLPASGVQLLLTGQGH
jgi:ABC-type Fe3+/spermidine/putrescine transport system ATPase subunit